MFLKLMRFTMAGALVGGTFWSPAQATTQTGMKISGMGLQGNTAYVFFTTALTETCAYNNLYYNVTTDDGKALYTLLLTARVSGLMLTRIDYTKRPDGSCFFDLAQI